jgi:hypothetical protein
MWLSMAKPKAAALFLYLIFVKSLLRYGTKNKSAYLLPVSIALL